MKLGERITYFRKKNNWSQGDLAERLNVSRQSVSKWETDGSVPDLDKLIQLSDLFAVSLDELVRGESDVKENVAKANTPMIQEAVLQEEIPQEEVLKESDKTFAFDAIFCMIGSIFLFPFIWPAGILMFLFGVCSIFFKDNMESLTKVFAVLALIMIPIYIYVTFFS